MVGRRGPFSGLCLFLPVTSQNARRANVDIDGFKPMVVRSHILQRVGNSSNAVSIVDARACQLPAMMRDMKGAITKPPAW